MIISFMGVPGAGKSTVAKKLAEKLGWPRYYMGGIRRAKAKERGMTLAEYNAFGETDPITDQEVDDFQAELGRTQDNFIIEGRTSWHLIPHSIKIYLDVDEQVGAQRVWHDLRQSDARNEDKGLKTMNDVLESHRARTKSDIERYEKYLDINPYDKSHFDFVLNTTELTPEETFEKVWDYIQSRMKIS